MHIRHKLSVKENAGKLNLSLCVSTLYIYVHSYNVHIVLPAS